MKNIALALLLMLAVSCVFALAQDGNKTKPTPQDSPTIVATLSLTGQTKTVPPTVLFTPDNNGLFRISIDMVVTQPKKRDTKNPYWVAFLNWTDVTDEGQEGPQVNAAQLGSQAGSATYPFSAAAGQPVIFSTRGNDHRGSSYDVFVVVEQLATIPSF